MMKNSILPLFCILLISCASVSFHDQSGPAGGPPEITESFPGDLPVPLPPPLEGIRYAVMENGKMFFPESQSRESDGDIFYLGNISKLYTAAAAFMLADRGLLNLDKPVADYLPDFRMKDDRYRNISSRMLLSHSSGLYAEYRKNAVSYQESNTGHHDTLLAYLASQNLLAEPGAAVYFCDTGFSLLELVIEKVSGKQFTAFLTENIFRPLGLRNTKTAEDISDGMKSSYQGTPLERYNDTAANGIYSNAEDLGIFSRVLAGKRPDILSPESARMMMTDQFPADVNAAGFGWDNTMLGDFKPYGVQVLCQGSRLEYASVLLMAPGHDISVIVYSPKAGASMQYAVKRFAAGVLLDILRERNIAAAEKKEARDIRSAAALPAQMEEYEGTYYHSRYGLVSMKADSGAVSFTGSDGKTVSTLYYAGENTFTEKDAEPGMLYSFGFSETGKLFVTGKEALLAAGDKAPDYNSVPASPVLVAQMLVPSPLPAQLKQSWEKRDRQRYYVADAHPLSKSYREKPFDLRLDFNTGYSGGSKIVNSNYAKYAVDIPGERNAGSDIEFVSIDNTEYLSMNGLTWLGENSMTPLGRLRSSIATIPENGFAQWFLIDSGFAGKKIHVAVPDGASFAVYDKNDECVLFSAMNGESSVLLPEYGKIVFCGKPRDVFTFNTGS